MNKKIVAILAALSCAPAFANGVQINQGALIKAAGETAIPPAVPTAVAVTKENSAPVAITYCWMKLNGVRRWVSAPFTLAYSGSATVQCEQTDPANPEAPPKPIAENPIHLRIYGSGHFIGIALPFSAPATSYFKIRVPDPFHADILSGSYSFDSARLTYVNRSTRRFVSLPIPKWAIVPPSASFDELPWLTFERE